MQQLVKLQYNILQKIYRYLFGIITVERVAEDLIIIFPNYKNFLGKFLYKKRINKKIRDILYSENVNFVVLSKSLKEDESIKNSLYEQNLHILNGKFLFEVLIIDCLKYISLIQNENVENLEITILSNDLSDNLAENIIFISNKVKILNIVTNNANKFIKLEKDIREKFGILIRISNNKRKSLSKSRIIFNIDFPEEILNKYQMNSTAILINISQKINVVSKKFSGINVHDYCIKIKNKDELIRSDLKFDFDIRDLYESVILKDRRFYNMRKRIEKDDIIISSLIGNNGVINEKEFII